MNIWVALGNDSAEYFATRHNIGWLFLDYLANRHQTSFQTQAWVYRARVQDITLIKLKSFMNTSGYYLLQAMNYYKWRLEDMLIIHDDIDFPLGVSKLRFGGSDGGHRGVSSVITSLAREDFWRLRLGICGELPVFETKEHKQRFMVDYVLSSFSKNELGTLEAMCKTLEPMTEMIACDPQKAMNQVNQKH